MKYIFVNETSSALRLHPKSIASRPSRLGVGTQIEVEIPKGTIPLIKVWDYSVLLSFIPKLTMGTK